MGKIILHTHIDSTREICFDLSCSIDLHLQSTVRSKERAIAGRTSGLIQLGESVTWKARHFGLWFKLKSRITQMERPHIFVDEMVSGPFKKMHHTHRFELQDSAVEMIDIFDYKLPVGPLGRLAETIVVNRYLKAFLVTRNNLIKEYAESDDYRKVLASRG